MENLTKKQILSRLSSMKRTVLQKLVGDGGNNACSSSTAGGEVNVTLSSLSETSSVFAQLILQS